MSQQVTLDNRAIPDVSENPTQQELQITMNSDYELGGDRSNLVDRSR